MLRDVKISDVGRIAEIYNYYIENTIVTFEEEKISVEDMERRIENVLKKRYPYIVCEEEGQVVGYAYVNNWRFHSAYDITLETSIYFDIHFTGKGLGKVLYSELIKKAKAINIHSLIGVMSLPNESSRRLHKKMGFCLVGSFKEVGHKFGRLIDVEFWQYFL
jgi:phosphinothricin acetyltransferase